jgi:hypothetical protein
MIRAFKIIENLHPNWWSYHLIPEGVLFVVINSAVPLLAGKWKCAHEIFST